MACTKWGKACSLKASDLEQNVTELFCVTSAFGGLTEVQQGPPFGSLNYASIKFKAVFIGLPELLPVTNIKRIPCVFFWLYLLGQETI